MILKETIGKWLHGRNSKFEIKTDLEGLNFVLSPEIFDECVKGISSVDELALHQYIVLQMLAEQGIADRLRNGFVVASDDAVRLDSYSRELLVLPPIWPGKFNVLFNGQTSDSSFNIQLRLVLSGGDEISHYELEGPFLKLTDTEVYLPTLPQWNVLSVIAHHQSLGSREKSEYQNLLAVHELQLAKNEGCAINLHHFDKLKMYSPESVAVSMTMQESGDLILTPSFGSSIELHEIDTRLGQLDEKKNVHSLRVKDTVILLDEAKLKAVHEIISNRVIPENQVKKFFETPTAFLNAALVDLDLGFSLRVRGATVFKHAYFGETDASGISWFEKALSGSSVVQSPNVLKTIINDIDAFHEIEKRIQDARNTGSGICEINGKQVDISDSNNTDKVLSEIREKLDGYGDSPDTDSHIRDDDNDSMVIDFILNDDIADFGSKYMHELMQDVPNIDMSEYARKPFPHQKAGILWVLGHSLPSLKLNDSNASTAGALLADDMGLGKTYMSLVAVSEYYKQCRLKNIVERPVLIVAPLSLLENWKQEVDLTYTNSPFNDIVLLQSGADLNRYRLKGTGVEIRQRSDARLREGGVSSEVPEDAIRYSLRIGSAYGPDRLDLPKRLVITTYQTLRDYQFSLCRIDWSFVIYDEAQNIKNPNTLVTRAAKGLKAKFKLLATGTPVENHLGDIWCLMDTARPGTLGAYQEFRKKYIVPIRRAGSDKLQEVRVAVGKELRNDVGALMLRRLKEDNLEGLPNKTIHVGLDIPTNVLAQYNPLLECTMMGEQLKRYNTAIEVVIDSEGSCTAGNAVLSGLHQLREISLHPLLLNGGILSIPRNVKDARSMIEYSAKLKTMMVLLDSIKTRNEKVIIFLINKKLQTFLKAALSKLYSLEVDIINGDTKAISRSPGHFNLTRKGLIDKFESRPGFGIIIMSPVAAGTGLNVVAANNVIHLERHWNPAKEDQASDRVHRIGQKRNVNIYLPILQHPEVPSFDVNLHSLLSSKICLKDAVVTPEEVSSEEMGRANFKKYGNYTNQDEPLSASDIDLLSWKDFEALCAELYSRHFNGSAQLTAQNDYGADVVILGSKNVLIQCKQTSKAKYDSTDILKDVISSKSIYEEKLGSKIDLLLAATTAKRFSRRVNKTAKTMGIELIQRDDIISLLSCHKVTRKNVQARLMDKRLFED